ncbi:MAG TPA: hypothetical protein VGP82_01375 [Ktedonobacterales bacterium]|jgi:hypothetical protein|nr:hypothetical protein [Ktedonobacterales bacterium]
MRRITFILSIIGTGLLALDNIGYFVVAAIASPNLHDVNQFFGVSFAIVVIIFFVTNGLAYILGLVDTARQGLWGWFALVLLLPVIGTLVYGAAGLRAPSAVQAAS